MATVNLKYLAVMHLTFFGHAKNGTRNFGNSQISIRDMYLGWRSSGSLKIRFGTVLREFIAAFSDAAPQAKTFSEAMEATVSESEGAYQNHGCILGFVEAYSSDSCKPNKATSFA